MAMKKVVKTGTSPGTSHGAARYAGIGAVALILVGGGAWLLLKDTAAPSPTDVASAPADPAPVAAAAERPPAVATAKPAPVAAPPAPAAAPPAQAQREAPKPPAQAGQPALTQLLLDARRMITRGDFAAADRALDQAEGLAPASAEVAAARNDLRDARRSTARRDDRIDRLVARARDAIAKRDYGAADRALDEAARFDGQDKQIEQARIELDSARAERPGRR